MLRSNELMIGDWVYHTSMRKYIKISGINGGVLFWYNKTAISACGMSLIEPTPITPEILEKNGFHFAKADRMSLTDRYVWGVEGTRDGAIVEITFYNPDVHGVKVLTKIHTQSSHESGINSVHSCDIESVHQLQHALRLCGIDKEIEL